MTAQRAGMTAHARRSSPRSPPLQASRLRDNRSMTPTKDGPPGNIGSGNIGARRQLLLLASQQLCNAQAVTRPKHSEDSDEEYIDL